MPQIVWRSFYAGQRRPKNAKFSGENRLTKRERRFTYGTQGFTRC
uniref:Uncharacterized protein n=1 Tax=Siphoviridae sp. ctTDf8 TaxID=2825517 RepID=A0A8S5UJ71_9CAUD|nr:MAG TPA: hypothetical protein [Siphoviridae sp. ctTDf8]